MRRRVEQQRVAVSGAGCDGVGSDGDAGHVEEGFIPEAAATLHHGKRQTLQRTGEWTTSLNLLSDKKVNVNK